MTWTGWNWKQHLQVSVVRTWICESSHESAIKALNKVADQYIIWKRFSAVKQQAFSKPTNHHISTRKTIQLQYFKCPAIVSLHFCKLFVFLKHFYVFYFTTEDVGVNLLVIYADLRDTAINKWLPSPVTTDSKLCVAVLGQCGNRWLCSIWHNFSSEFYLLYNWTIRLTMQYLKRKQKRWVNRCKNLKKNPAPWHHRLAEPVIISFIDFVVLYITIIVSEWEKNNVAEIEM